MRVRSPEPVVIGWSFRPAAMISVVTPSIIRWAANSSARLFRPSLSRVGMSRERNPGGGDIRASARSSSGVNIFVLPLSCQALDFTDTRLECAEDGLGLFAPCVRLRADEFVVVDDEGGDGAARSRLSVKLCHNSDTFRFRFPGRGEIVWRSPRLCCRYIWA